MLIGAIRRFYIGRFAAAVHMAKVRLKLKTFLCLNCEFSLTLKEIANYFYRRNQLNTPVRAITGQDLDSNRSVLSQITFIARVGIKPQLSYTSEEYASTHLVNFGSSFIIQQ